jgi:hypothetical protein
MDSKGEFDGCLTKTIAEVVGTDARGIADKPATAGRAAIGRVTEGRGIGETRSGVTNRLIASRFIRSQRSCRSTAF